MDLSGRRTLITGAGRGIGLAIAHRFVSAGARVAIADIDEDGARSAAQELGHGTIAVRVMSAARQTLERLALDVPGKLGDKPTLLIWGMKDPLFPPKSIPQMRATFTDHVLVELPHANHFIQEDAPDRIAEAIAQRFGS